jgi:outer membrane cobalamin receptor
MAHQAIRATIRVQNLFSETYQGIIGRTMPGRNYTFGLLYQFH